MEVLTGLIAGIVSGLGMGGGSILILILVNFVGIEQHMAQATNLLFFIPTAIVASIVNYKNKLIKYRLGLVIVFFGLIGAVIGAKISTKIDSDSLRKYFGFFLIFIAIYEVFSIVKQYKKLK